MQESIVTRLLQGRFDGQLEKAWQIFKHHADLRDLRPNVRFSAEVLPAYYQSEVLNVEPVAGGAYSIKTSVSALSGNDNSIPNCMFKEALAASFDMGNDAPLNFLDTFNNRYYRLYCETQQKHDLTYQMEEETFQWNRHRQSMTNMLACLTGQSAEASPIAESHLIQYTGLLGLKLTCPLALKGILDDYFDAEFTIDRSELDYFPLTPCSLTQIGRQGQNQLLGLGALVGKSTPMVGQRLNIKICPNNYQHYLKIRNDKKMIQAVDHLVRSYMGVNTKYALYMKVNSQYLPRARLSSDRKQALRIGQSAWMNNQSNSQQFVEMPLTKS